MHILLFVPGPPSLRHFESTLALLTSQGETVTVAAPTSPRDKGLRKPLAGNRDVRLLHFEWARDDALDSALKLLRLTRDYLQYSSPELASAYTNRQRVKERLLREVNVAGTAVADPFAEQTFLELDETAARSLDRKLARIESLVPGNEGVDEVVRRLRPDVVLVTPLVMPGTRQVEVVKAARKFGVPCGFPVFSWDNLSNKGRIHLLPDRVFVWNEVQKREAVELHGLDPAAVTVTGAPRFDEFFELTPSDSREGFCSRYGLDPARPIVLYLGSSPTVTATEEVVAEKWLACLREGPVELSSASVVVRPHPRRREIWEDWPGRGDPHVAVSPRPTVLGDQSLYDELHHSAVVVGLNTSAEIEAAIVRRPVYTFSAGDLAPGQEGSTHFGYLLTANGGCVAHAGTLDEHVGHLADALAGRFDREAITRFVRSFVRPAGLDQPATPILADAIRDLATPHVPLSARLRSRVTSLRTAKSQH